jgi:hypothetical protein
MCNINRFNCDVLFICGSKIRVHITGKKHQLCLVSLSVLLDISMHGGDVRNVYKILVRKPEGRRPLRRPRCRWDDKIRWVLGKYCGKL